MAEDARRKFVDPELTDDWRKEVSTLASTFEFVDEETGDEDDEFSAFLVASEFSDKRQKVLLLIDIAKTYLHQIEAEVLFLFMKNRRNKDISLVLGIQEPEVARFKKLIIKKSIVYYMFKYVIDIMDYHPYIVQLFELNEKQAEILKYFFDFRSLSYISKKCDSKSSNMHRSLNSIKKKLQESIKEHPELEPALMFFTYSKYINNPNENPTIVQQLI